MISTIMLLTNEPEFAAYFVDNKEFETAVEQLDRTSLTSIKQLVKAYNDGIRKYRESYAVGPLVVTNLPP